MAHVIAPRGIILNKIYIPNLVKKCFNEHMSYILQGKKLMDCIYLLFTQIDAIYKNDFTIEDLIIRKTCSANYVNPNHFMSLLMRRYPTLRDGDMVGFVVINKKTNLFVEKICLIDDYQATEMTIDYKYYVKLLYNKTSKLLATGFHLSETYIENISLPRCIYKDKTIDEEDDNYNFIMNKSYKSFMFKYILNSTNWRNTISICALMNLIKSPH